MGELEKMNCHHDIRTQADGSKFCQKCFSEWPSKVRKMQDFYVKLRRDKIADFAKRKKSVSRLFSPMDLPSGILDTASKTTSSSQTTSSVQTMEEGSATNVQSALQESGMSVNSPRRAKGNHDRWQA